MGPQNDFPEDMISLLRSYVERNHDITNIDWDPHISLKLFFDPYSLTQENKRLASHYFLLAASIAETKLIGRPENSRALLIHLNDLIWQGLFEEKNERRLQIPIERCEFYNALGPDRAYISRIIASVNRFVAEEASGDLTTYYMEFRTPQEIVNELANKIYRMSESHIEKAWMYLTWMTRPKPNLNIFTQYKTSDLKLPLTSQIRAVGASLGVINSPDQPTETNRETVREKITNLAKELFPEDPTVVDYPFFMLGRWLSDKVTKPELIHHYLLFFDEIYRKTGSSPVIYDIGSRTKSMFEKYIRGELEKKKIVFWYEPATFKLPNGLTYRPDFLLPKYSIDGRKVVLEPHGVWDGRNGEEVAYKYRVFRKAYGEDYYLILIVPSDYFHLVKERYFDSYDDLLEGNRTPDLLYSLKNDCYRKAIT